MNVEEGTEWEDGVFSYIAYRKADGTMVVRDVEGFDYPMETWLLIMQDPDVVEVNDVEPVVRIQRWEAEVGPLPRS